MLKNKRTKGKIYTAISVSLLLALSIPAFSKASTATDSYSDRSLFYTEIFNSGFPILKSIALDDDDKAELNYSLKTKLLEFVGLDISNPLSIVSREFNLIKDGDPETALRETKTPFILNPFKLDENNIIKNTEVTPPDKTVDYTKVAEVYNPKLKKTLNPAKPEVLIYHSHTTESYAPDGKYNLDPNKNMVAVGEVIKKELENNYGIAVVHDTTVHNYPNSNAAYTKSGKTLDKYLNEYKDFKIIIDLHRDGINESSASTVVTKLNNKNLARFMFVIGTGNPNKDKNLALARKLSKISEDLFPGLIRSGNAGDYGTYYFKSAKFHQQKNPNILIIELGAQTNTLEEAKTTAVYIARIFAEYINGQQ